MPNKKRQLESNQPNAICFTLREQLTESECTYAEQIVAIVVFFFGGIFSGVVDRVRLVLCPKENFKLIFVVFINKY